MKRRIPFALGLAVAGLAFTMPACSVFDDDDDDRRTVTDTSPYGGVPANAIRAAQGYDTIRYRASQPGRVIVGNDVSRTIITETRVNAGDEVTVDANGDRVLVNGSPIYQQNLQKRDQHSIFFVPG